MIPNISFNSNLPINTFFKLFIALYIVSFANINSYRLLVYK